MIDNTTAVEWLKEIIRIDSTLGNEKEVADYIKILLDDAGIPYEEITYAEGRTQLVATLEGTGEGKVLGISGHMDVVPVGENEWEYDPFSATEVDGKIYGRGSSDMKSGVMAAVVAMINLKESGTAFNGKLKLLLTAGEETSAVGSEQLTELGYADYLDALLVA